LTDTHLRRARRIKIKQKKKSAIQPRIAGKQFTIG